MHPVSSYQARDQPLSSARLCCYHDGPAIGRTAPIPSWRVPEKLELRNRLKTAAALKIIYTRPTTSEILTLSARSAAATQQSGVRPRARHAGEVLQSP